WSFDGSIYFGCREPHLPLEYGYARALLTDAGHDAAIFDAQIDRIDTASLQSRVADFSPDLIVVTTAPGHLFSRSATPERRGPQPVASARLAGLCFRPDSTPRPVHHHHRFDTALHAPGAEM